jgi:FHA domain
VVTWAAMACVSCGNASEIGALCCTCAVDIAPCDGLIPDHIASAFDPPGKGWLVDGFGGAHAIGARGTIGRNLDGDVVVLASSVSREHAQIALGETGWTVRDLGSRNGTFVGGTRITAEVALPDHAVLRFGDVAMLFLARVACDPPRRPEISTGGPSGGPMRYQFSYGTSELCVIAGSDTTAAGGLRWRTAGSDSWAERALGRLEFQLLRALCIRAHAEAASPSPVRGCVQTKQLLRDLPFQSKYANHENVRQVVLRLRAALAEVGASGVLAVAPGRGYYLACNVTAGPVTGQSARF